MFQDVQLTGFSEETPLGKDLKAWAQKCNCEVGAGCSSSSNG